MINDLRSVAIGLVDEFLGHRLESAGNAPGLREATIDLTATALESDDLEQLISNQLRQLRSPSSIAIPDAYLADEAATEDALQRAAAGIRVALAQSGKILDARSFERGAALRLGDDPRLPIRAELARVPRPLTRPEALQWSIEPAPWARQRDEDDTRPTAGLDAAASRRCIPGGVAALARVDDGPHAGWIQIGMIERHLTPACRYPARPSRMVLIAAGLEITDTEPPVRSLPFTSSPWQLWTLPWRRLDPKTDAAAAARQLSTCNSPAVALTHTRRAGLGPPPFLLTPILPLIVALELTPTPGVCGFSLSDGNGPGLVGRQWRGHLVHDGNYQPLTPAIHGADLLLRPDLLARLLDIVGETRIRAGIAVSHQTGGEDVLDE